LQRIHGVLAQGIPNVKNRIWHWPYDISECSTAPTGEQLNEWTAFHVLAVMAEKQPTPSAKFNH
jgi:hypothetical protein